MFKTILASLAFCVGIAKGGILEDRITYEEFANARKEFVQNNGGGPYISGGREILNKGTARSMTDADIGILSISLFKKKAVGKEVFFRGLFSEAAYIRCASCYVMKYLYGRVAGAPEFRYMDDPFSDNNWENIIFWRKCLSKGNEPRVNQPH